MVKRTLLVVLSFTLLLISVPTLVNADPVISAPFMNVGVGDTFTIPISITDAVDLSSWQFDLTFNPVIVQANVFGATAGGALPGNWFFTSPGGVDNLNGHILGVSAFGFGSAFNGSGVIANIEFHALAPGVSLLTLSNVAVNLFEPVVSTNGQITVTGPTAVPEPTTLILLASGLVLLGGMRRLTRRGRRVKF